MDYKKIAVKICELETLLSIDAEKILESICGDAGRHISDGDIEEIRDNIIYISHGGNWA